MIASSPRGPLTELARERWDLLVIGGGITGAGVFREAARLGLRTLLVERVDFAAGTSSHSAKLIHGGLHYFARGKVGLAIEAVREREHLLHEATGLIDPLEFILPLREDRRLYNRMTAVGIGVYEAIGGRLHRPKHLRGPALARAAPGLDGHYVDALSYTDAQTDDARLVLRVLADGRRAGGVARNYTGVTGFARDAHGELTGVWLHDALSGDAACVEARHVVNAAGPWSDELRRSIGRSPRQRLVRGSHIVFPHERLPIVTAMAVYHADSGLPLYLAPWRGTTLAGTTHVDTGTWVDSAPRASAGETAYLLHGVQAVFPERCLTLADLQATFAGLRPIVDTRSGDPARASRDFGVWEESGLITVTGGKLTTFRMMARAVMKRIVPRADRLVMMQRSEANSLGNGGSGHLHGMYGDAGAAAIHGMPEHERAPLPGGCSLAEIRWTARTEDVVHLDDLLFRRVRLGLTAPEGGAALLDRIEPVAREELGWDAERWAEERAAYLRIWQELYAVTPVAQPLLARSPALASAR